eukprot:gene47622-58338_t
MQRRQEDWMKTRDRILECALMLFNSEGEPNVTTLEIATELGISPGNLYYHFHGKEPLVMALLERFQDELAPLLDPPEDVELGVEDYWLFLHLIVERLAQYRFLFQDLSNLAGRLPKLARGMRAWLNALKRTLASLLARLKARDQLVSDTESLGQLVERHDVLRIKGFAAIPGKPMRLLVQGVGKRFDKHFDRKWLADETRATRLVVIGQELDPATIANELRTALA